MRKSMELDFSRFAPEFTSINPWGQCLTSFLGQYSAARTYKNYRAILFQFLTTPAKMPQDYTVEEIKSYLASPIRVYRKQLTDQASSKGTRRIRHNALCGFYRYASHMLITDESGQEHPLYTPSAEMDAFLFIGRKPKHLPPDQPKQPQPRVHALEPNFAFSPESDWGRCVESFIRRTFEKSGSQSTRDHYRAILTRFFNGPPAKLPHLYTREDCESFLHLPGRALGRVGKPTKHSTMNNALSCLKSFYAHAATFAIEDSQGIPQPLLDRLAPTAGIWQTQKEKPPYRSISEEDLRRLFAAIPRDTPIGLRDYALILTLFYTARRRHEITSLTWGSITQTMIIDPGGKSRMGYLYSWYGKGHSRQIDQCELPAICYRAIVVMLEADGRLFTIQPGDPLFTTCKSYSGQRGHDPHRSLADVTVWHLVKRYAAAAGLDPRTITTHSFRHASAMHRYLAGEDVFSIRNVLRHSSLDMTAIYLRELVGQSDNGSTLLESRFGNL